MIITVLAYDVMGVLHLQVATKMAETAAEGHLEHWRSSTTPMPPWSVTDDRDAVAAVGECLLDLCYRSSAAETVASADDGGLA